MLAAPIATADAHEVGRAECRTYQAMHLLITGSQRLAEYWGRQCRIAATAHMNTHPIAVDDMPDILERIRDCESGDRLANGRARPGSHDYRAKNRTSTASGAYQFLDTTWGGWDGYSRASEAPPRVQDRKAIRHWRLWGTSPWAKSAGCWS